VYVRSGLTACDSDHKVNGYRTWLPETAFGTRIGANAKAGQKKDKPLAHEVSTSITGGWLEEMDVLILDHYTRPD
jgi:hypothetical protein